MGDTASLTMRTEHLVAILKLAVKNRDCISTIEVSGAYLHATMNIDVFMIIPAHVTKYYIELNPVASHYLRSDGSLLVRLQKGIL